MTLPILCSLLLIGLGLAELGSRRRLHRLNQPVCSRWRLIADLAALLALVALYTGSTPAAVMTQTDQTIALVVDVSTSMAVTDASGSRMATARRELLTLLELQPQTRFALLPFAGEPVLQVAPTSDRKALRFFISALEPGLISAPGSAPEEAVRAAQRLLAGETGERLVLLISDGERTLLAPPPDLQTDIPVYTLTVGADSGGPVPGLAPAFSRPDRQRLSAIAALTGGAVLETPTAGVAVHALPTPLTTPTRQRVVDLAPIVALILLGARYLSSRSRKIRLLLASSCLFLPLLLPGCQPEQQSVSSLGQIDFARGLQAAASGDLASAKQAFATAADQLDDEARSAALYNRGTLLLLTGQAQDAVTLFEAALLQTPGDVLLRDNLLLALQETDNNTTDGDTDSEDQSDGGDQLSPQQARTLINSIDPDPALLPATKWIEPKPVREVW